jgi:hypothetical protein
MGLAQINHEFPSPAGRFLLLTTKVINLTLLSKDYPIFFLDAANLEINQKNLFPLLFFTVKLSIIRLEENSSRFLEDLPCHREVTHVMMNCFLIFSLPHIDSSPSSLLALSMPFLCNFRQLCAKDEK